MNVIWQNIWVTNINLEFYTNFISRISSYEEPPHRPPNYVIKRIYLSKFTNVMARANFFVYSHLRFMVSKPTAAILLTLKVIELNWILLRYNLMRNNCLRSFEYSNVWLIVRPIFIKLRDYMILLQKRLQILS